MENRIPRGSDFLIECMRAVGKSGLPRKEEPCVVVYDESLERRARSVMTPTSYSYVSLGIRLKI